MRSTAKTRPKSEVVAQRRPASDLSIYVALTRGTDPKGQDDATSRLIDVKDVSLDVADSWKLAFEAKFNRHKESKDIWSKIDRIYANKVESGGEERAHIVVACFSKQDAQVIMRHIRDMDFCGEVLFPLYLDETEPGIDSLSPNE